MQILYSYPDRVGKATGGGAAALHQVEALARLGLSVHLVCTTADRTPVGVRSVTETLRVFGQRIPHRVLGGRGAYAYHDWATARYLARHGSEFDVVHCWPGATLRTAATAARVGVPVLREVINSHTAHAFEVVARETERLGLELPRGHSHSFDRRTLEREEAEYAAADRLLIPSEWALETFLDRDVREEKLDLHQYGCSPEALSLPVVERAPERPFTALFAASCEPRKGLHLALEAWHGSGAAEQGELLICGSFAPGYRDVVESLLTHPSIKLLGFVDDLPGVMAGADVFLLPSLEDGSALVTYDAQAAGCVLLASRAAGARCEHGRHGLIHEPGDVSTLTGHLRDSINDPDLLRRLRTTTLKERDRLSWDISARKLNDSYARARA